MDLTDAIRKESKKFYGLPFWSWNDKLEKERLFDQMRDMKANNYGGFFMHARGGLQTEYFSDEWFELIKACADEAEKEGLEAWAYDENGWPSGFADGKLLKDKENLAAFLTCRTGRFDKRAFAVYDTDGKRADANSDSDSLINVYKNYSYDYVDLLNPLVVDRFINTVHEEYKKRFGTAFSKKIAGFFTDEPQYYRYHTPWSDTFTKVFNERFGYDVFEALPALFIDFDGAKELRYDYHLLCHELYIDSVAKKLYGWCEDNKVKLTGHTIEETTLRMQMWCCGGVMPFYEYEHIPGIDHLTKTINTDLCTKQIGSVAAQLGKERVLTESFAACGWDVSPLVLKRNVQWQFVAGINTLCHHLYPYSERGERKYDYPAHYSEHLPWHKYMRDFNRYFANIACAMSMGSEKANVLVIHPIRSAYLYYMRDHDDDAETDIDKTILAHLEKPFEKLLKKLGKDNVQYHLGDETLIKKYGFVDGKQFAVGKCRYNYVIVPYAETVDSNTAELLDRFISGGGKVYFAGKIPFRIDGRISAKYHFSSNVKYADILRDREAFVGNADVRMNIRDSKYGRIFYIANTTDKSFKYAVLKIKDCKGICRINPLTLEKQKVEYVIKDNQLQVALEINDSDDYLFAESNDSSRKNTVVKERIFTYGNNKLAFSERPENCFVLDFAQLSFDGENFEAEKYIKHIHERLIKKKYNGKVYLKFKINSGYAPDKLLLCCEPLKNLEVRINSKKAEKLDGYRIDKSFCLFEAADCFLKGENTIVLCFDYFQSEKVFDVMFSNAMENKRNSLALDTEIEPVYLFGDFYVSGKFKRGKQDCTLCDGGFCLCPPKKSVKTGNIVTDGYPFFFGGIKVRTNIGVQTAGIYEIKLPGEWDVCNVFINGKTAATLMFDKACDVYLKAGNNTVEFEFINSMRNTFGPLHHADDECAVASPGEFTFEGGWEENSLPQEFVKRYSFKRFGMDKIILSSVTGI